MISPDDVSCQAYILRQKEGEQECGEQGHRCKCCEQRFEACEGQRLQKSFWALLPTSASSIGIVQAHLGAVSNFCGGFLPSF